MTSSVLHTSGFLAYGVHFINCKMLNNCSQFAFPFFFYIGLLKHGGFLIYLHSEVVVVRFDLNSSCMFSVGVMAVEASGGLAGLRPETRWFPAKVTR